MFRNKIFVFNNRVAQLLLAIFFACTYCLGASAQTVEPSGWHEVLKVKFIEGDAAFMSLVAFALVLGLAFCIERIIYLSMSEIDTDAFQRSLDEKISNNDIEGVTRVAPWPLFVIRGWCAATLLPKILNVLSRLTARCRWHCLRKVARG